MPARYYREKRAVVAILGATATGKTATAVRLCLDFQGEVISVDSRYLYRGLDIGTAKPRWEERRSVPHHLIDIAAPQGGYSLAQFLAQARTAIESIS
jgi:tRNA dimethylallyltransferase